MSYRRNIVSVLILFSAISAFPMTAWADAATGETGQTEPPSARPTPDVLPDYLSMDEAKDPKNGIYDFNLKIINDDAVLNAVLTGRVPTECAKYLIIKNENKNNKTVFTIEKVDGFTDCITKTVIKGFNCNLQCSNLSSLINANVVLNNDTTVHLKWQNGGDSTDPENWKYSEGLTYISQATKDKMKQADEAKAAERQEAEKRKAEKKWQGELKHQVAHCRSSREEIEVARNAIEQLIESFDMTQKAAKAANKDIDEDEIKLFANRVKTASENELGKLREEMRDWAKEHPGYAEKLAPIFHKIALRYVNQKNAGTDAYELASESISEAQSLKGLSEASDLRLENYQRDISVGKVQSIASLGISNNMVFGPNYAALMQNLYNDAMNACNGYNASMETCSNVIGAIRTASAIPARAQQVEQQRNQTQMQIQQTLGQAGINMMPMTPAWAGGYYGSQSGFIRNI